MDLFEKCARFTSVREAMAQGLYAYFRPIASAQDAEVVVNGRRLIMIGSNNYLGLANHPRVKEAAIEAVRRYGTGCAGSRFLNGTLDIHEELERKLARFVRKEAAAVFATGFQTNLGVISSLVGKNDVAIIDKLDHASIIDGCRLAQGEVRRFRHNDMEDLERVLREYPDRGKLVVVDGVYGMEGDIANLPEIARLCRAYGARLMVDDAHSLGVLGRDGHGTAEHFGLEDEVDLIMGTYSKSLATVGGFIAGREEVIHYIKHHARSMIFSASLPPASVASVSAALDVIEQEPELRERLWENTRRMQRGLRELGYDIGPTQTPIVPVILKDPMLTFRMARLLEDYGVFANPVVPPAVPPKRSLIRTSYMATHTPEQLDRALEAFARAGRELGVIP